MSDYRNLMLLSDLTWKEAKAVFEEGVTVVVPTGSNEQHGPHMPVNCDSFYVTKVTDMVVQRLKSEMLIYKTPTIWTGYSPHHREFPGTITINLPTFLSLIYDVCESLVRHNVRRIFLINGHGGNEVPLRAVASQIGNELDHSPIVLNYWDVINNEWNSYIKDLPGVGHAGEVETSFRKYLAPETIREDELERAEFVTEDPHPLTVDSYEFRRFCEVNQKGYTGNPKWGTREKGEKMINRIVDLLSNVIREDHNKKK